MATPLAPYANARLLIATPGARGGPESGYKRTAGALIVVSLFLKQVSPEKRSVFKQITTASVASDFLQGYVIGFVELPEDEDWLTYELTADAGYDSSGARPVAMYKGGEIKALQFGGRQTKAATVVEAAGVYDDQGIGGIVRDVIGDRIVISCEWRQ